MLIYLLPLSAGATTFISEPPNVQLERASVAIVATVASRSYAVVHDDGEDFPVTHYVLTVDEALLGEVTSGVVRLGLPGGPLGDSWVHSPGVPELSDGEQVFVVGTKHSEDVIRLTGWTQSIFRRVGDSDSAIAVDAAHNPLGGFGCDLIPWILRPLNQAPSSLYDGVAMTAEEAASLPYGPVFVETPSEWGMYWGDFIATYRTCIAASSNPGGTLAGYLEEGAP